MRLPIAAFAITLIATGTGALTSADAQGLGAGNMATHQNRAKQDEKNAAAPKQKNEDNKAYDAALRTLPNKQYDPWHGVR